jgi:exonuclease I
LKPWRGADEVGGWSNIKKMGMAVGVCYETSTKKYHVFEEHQVADLINLLRSADLIVGFNHVRFDYEVLRGYNSFRFQ